MLFHMQWLLPLINTRTRRHKRRHTKAHAAIIQRVQCGGSVHQAIFAYTLFPLASLFSASSFSLKQLFFAVLRSFSSYQLIRLKHVTLWCNTLRQTFTLSFHLFHALSMRFVCIIGKHAHTHSVALFMLIK